MAKPRRIWPYNESKVFFKSWKDNVFLYRFLKKHYNKDPLLSAICKDLKKAGYSRSLTEINSKMKNYRQYAKLVAPESRLSNYRWYAEVKEILKLEKIERGRRQATSAETEQASELYEQNVDGGTPKSVELVGNSLHKGENNSDSDLLSPTVMKHGEPEVPNNIQTSLPQSSGSSSKKSAEAILLDICREFRISNRELEDNDIAILELFKEQNDTFKKQTKLLMNFL